MALNLFISWSLCFLSPFIRIINVFLDKWFNNGSFGSSGLTDPKLMPKETVNVVGIGFRKSDSKFRDAFNVALAKVLANPGKMLERAGKYGYDKAQLPPPDMTTEWACSTK